LPSISLKIFASCGSGPESETLDDNCPAVAGLAAGAAQAKPAIKKAKLKAANL
jgi:hypothetical protein